MSRIIWVILSAFVLRACVLEPVRLTDESMVPVVSEGETVLVSKLKYGLRIPGSGVMLLDWNVPQKGDLVVVVSVGDPPVNLLRRITSVPGEKVQVEGKEVTLLKDQYMLSAEQKEGAMDSRQFGIVSRRAIIGKATYIWMPKNQIASTEGGSKVESKSRFLQPIL